MCLAWKILKILGRDVDRKSIPLKIVFISVLRFELWHRWKSMLPSAKGLSIYFYVILLLLLSHHPLIRAPVGEHYCHFYALSIVNVGCDHDWISFTLNYNVQSQKGLARYHVIILYHDCFDKVLAFEICYYC